MFRNRLWLAGLAIFAALSATDFTQTYALIHAGDGTVYEANPVAAPWLERYGWHGLAAYKLAAVLVVAGVVVVLAGRNRRAANGVAALGCLAVLSVTLYSRDLIANGPPRPAPEEVVEEWTGWPPGEEPAEVKRLMAASAASQPPAAPERLDGPGVRAE